MATPVAIDAGPRPADSELDLFGLTHPGKVRKDNQDHFLVCTIHPQVVIHGTSLPDAASFHSAASDSRRHALVADGVGGAAAAATRRASRPKRSPATSRRRCAAITRPARRDEREFLDALRAAALEAHKAVLADAASSTSAASVGDHPHARHGRVAVDVRRPGRRQPLLSLRSGMLRQVTRDQTVAQTLVDEGCYKPTAMRCVAVQQRARERDRRRGGDKPEVTRVDISQTRGVVLLCSDGLTKHVKDDELAEHLD